jgi:hypothetical protein
MKGHAGNNIYPYCAITDSFVPYTIPVTDHTSFTAIWSQPVTAPQIKDWDGQWHYIRHVDNALVSHGVQVVAALLIMSVSYGISQLQRAEDRIEYEIVNGVRFTHYNLSEWNIT